MSRIAALACFAAALLVAGCGNRHDGPVTVAETEGIYLEIGELTYQVQISRQLNPADVEDKAYLMGVSDSTLPPEGDETWFAVFIRVQNQTDEALPAAEEFEIVDTQKNVYTPVAVDATANPFAYVPGLVPPGGLIPATDSAAADGPIQGSLLLFKIPFEAVQNRPLEFKIHAAEGDAEGEVSLDV